MASTVVLGPVTFTDREVPDTMPFGGKQAMAIHKNLGGKRIVDVMGPDPDPIQWSGLFIGKDASKRARLLDALKDTGAELRLAWGSFNYLVVISHFRANYKHEWEVAYQITVEVSTVNPVAQLPGLTEIIKRDWTSAIGIPGLPASITSAINAAQAAVNAVALTLPNGNLANASMAALAPAIAASEKAYFSVDSLLRSTEAGMTGGSLDVAGGRSVREGYDAFATEANKAASASNLRTARGYLGRIVGNLTTLGG